jgi:hypothetical protein
MKSINARPDLEAQNREINHEDEKLGGRNKLPSKTL